MLLPIGLVFGEKWRIFNTSMDRCRRRQGNRQWANQEHTMSTLYFAAMAVIVPLLMVTFVVVPLMGEITAALANLPM